MFQFSGFAHLSVYYVFNIVGCPIQVSTDHIVCADPRSFSQLITPFIASESLGIPHTPLFCLLYFAQLTANSSQLKLCSFYFLLFSYLNMSMNVFSFLLIADYCQLLVENNGVEPLASCVQGRRSSQLS